MKQKNDLIKGLKEVDAGDLILYCMPYAGGGASAYYSWQTALDFKVCPIQLPGREERISEKAYRSMDEVVPKLVRLIEQQDNRYAIFGHSMGAKMAYEVEKGLEQRGRTAEVVIVSGSLVPHKSEPNPIHQLSDLEFKRELMRFEGTPKAFAENEELMNWYLPMLKADFTLGETYTAKRKIRLKCPITAFAGDNDHEANPSELKLWEAYTETSFTSKIFGGSHFFIKESAADVLAEIALKLKQAATCKTEEEINQWRSIDLRKQLV